MQTALHCPRWLGWQASMGRNVASQTRANAQRRGRETKGPKLQRRGTRVLNDLYFRDAQKAGFLSRAAFKLQQLDDKHKVLKAGGHVLDLGCFPGAWLQVASQRLGPIQKGGQLVGIDLKKMSVPQKHCDERVKILQGDAQELSRSALATYAPYGFDTVLSDMCHDTCGSADADVARSLQLCECAAVIALGLPFFLPKEGQDPRNMLPESREELEKWRLGTLREGGNLVMKILQGQGTKEFAESLRPAFRKVAFFRPKATRSESREVYIVCCGNTLQSK